LYKIYNFTKDTINNVVQNNLLELKDKTEEFFDITKENKIPTIIFSAGIYNIIHEFLKSRNKDFENIHVISNQFKFNESGIFTGIIGDTIHSMNKTFDQLKSLNIFSEIKDKKACILIGDTTSDAQMVNGSKFEVILKIGFFNRIKSESNYEQNLKDFQNHFDIIVDGKDDFMKINQILKDLI